MPSFADKVVFFIQPQSVPYCTRRDDLANSNRFGSRAGQGGWRGRAGRVEEWNYFHSLSLGAVQLVHFVTTYINFCMKKSKEKNISSLFILLCPPDQDSKHRQKISKPKLVILPIFGKISFTDRNCD